MRASALLAAAVIAAAVICSAAAAPSGLTVGGVELNLPPLPYGMDGKVTRALEVVEGAMNRVEEVVNVGWKHMLDNYSEFAITAGGTFVVHEVLYFAAWIPWLLLDLVPGARRWKIQKPRATALEDTDQLWKCFKGIAWSHVVIELPMMMIFHFVVALMGFEIGMPLPGWKTFVWQVPLFFVIEDTYFYWGHRFLHWKKIYKYIHKVHHEHQSPFGIAAEYAHPLETVFLGIGTVLGPFLFAKHLASLWVWLAFRLWETIEDHSGYDVPFNPTNLIPFWGGPVHHDFHHKNFDGNYASVFTYWDWIMGTDRDFQSKQLAGKPGLGYPLRFRGAAQRGRAAAEKAAADKAAKKAK